MNNNEIRWLSQNYKQLRSGCIILTIILSIAPLLFAYAIKIEAYPYGLGSMFGYFVWGIAIVLIWIFLFVMTIFNYRNLVKKNIVPQKSVKLYGLLIFELICLSITILVICIIFA